MSKRFCSLIVAILGMCLAAVIPAAAAPPGPSLSIEMTAAVAAPSDMVADFVLVPAEQRFTASTMDLRQSFPEVQYWEPLERAAASRDDSPAFHRRC